MAATLVTPQWLNAHLDHPRLRLFDCSLTMQFQPVGKSLLTSGRSAWKAAHIRGAGFLAMETDFSQPNTSLPYGLPAAEHVQDLLRSEGVNNGDIIVLYGSGYQGPVTRMWWVLTASGVADVRILNGGLEAWGAAGFALEADLPLPRERGDFTAQPRAQLRVTATEVAAAINNPDTVLLNALSPEQFDGSGGAHYGRVGRIPSSISVPFRSLMHEDSQAFKSPEDIRAILQAAGVLQAKRIYSYCGGGIAASGTTFALHLIGREDAALYDGSLTDWSADPTRPMVTGAPQIMAK